MTAAAILPQSPAEERLLLQAVPWPTYDTLLHCLGDWHARLTYDRKVLEIMTVSSANEWAKKMLARLVEALTEELDIYYLCEEFPLRSRDEIDMTMDPPPDLALEKSAAASWIA